jgi:hypothetical protein
MFKNLSVIAPPPLALASLGFSHKFYLGVPYVYHSKQPLFTCTTLTDWSL